MNWKVIGFAQFACLIVAMGLLWNYRLDFSRLVAIRLIERSGLGPVALIVSRIDSFGLRAQDITLCGGAVRIAEFSLAYEPMRLAAGTVDSALIAGLHVSIATAGGEFTIGGVPLRFAASPDGAPPTSGFRIGAVKVVQAHVVFDDPTGRLEAAFSTDLAVSGSDIRNTAFAVDLTLPIGDSVRRMHIVAPVLALSSLDGGGIRLLFDQTSILPEDILWAVDGLGGEIVWRADRLFAKVGSSRVRDLRSPALIVPLSVTGDATMVGSLIEFAIHLADDNIGAKAKIQLNATGRHDGASGTGLSSITATPLVFKPGGPRPHDFFPALGAMAGVSGSVALSGDVTWHGAAFSPALVLRLADVAYEPEGARASKIHGNIHLTGLWPVATAPGQVLHGTVEGGGLPPSDATLTFHLSPKPALSVEGMRMDFVGGQIVASPFVIDPTRPDFATVVGLRQIDLATAFRIISVEGLGGSGHIDGVIPLTVSGGKVAIRNGKLAASGPGVLQVQSDILPKQITEAGESMTLALGSVGFSLRCPGHGSRGKFHGRGDDRTQTAWPQSPGP